MKSIFDMNPIPALIFFFEAALAAVLTFDPIMCALSLVGAVILAASLRVRVGWRKGVGIFALFAVMALINPLVYHNGVTVLFVFNNNPVTLEAVLFGVFSSSMIVSVILWFISFSAVMTSEKLLYVFGCISPKIALIFSMVLRYIPLFSAQMKKISQSQKALGLYKEDNIIDTLRGKMRIFSVMVTWTLENGIITADSMSARGYGCGRRTYFRRFSFCSSDAVFLAVTALLTSASLYGTLSGALAFGFYPSMSPLPSSVAANVAHAAYALLVLMPSVIQFKESLKWKYLLAKA